MSRLNATTTESVLDNIEVQRALNIAYTNGFLDGKKAQNKKDINKAVEWVKYGNENGGCLFDGWEKSLRKAMEGEK